jgi:hypothetical protein
VNFTLGRGESSSLRYGQHGQHIDNMLAFRERVRAGHLIVSEPGTVLQRGLCGTHADPDTAVLLGTSPWEDPPCAHHRPPAGAALHLSIPVASSSVGRSVRSVELELPSARCFPDFAEGTDNQPGSAVGVDGGLQGGEMELHAI